MRVLNFRNDFNLDYLNYKKMSVSVNNYYIV